jgi:hypothetical protein
LGFKLTSQIIRRQIQRIRPRRHPIIAIPRLRIPGCTAQDEIRIIVEEMPQAVIVAIYNNTIICHDDLDQRCEVGPVVRGGHIGVVELEEFPGRVGGGEGAVQEVDVYRGDIEAGGGVGVFVDGCALGGG